MKTITLIVALATSISAMAHAAHIPKQGLIVGEAATIETEYIIGDVAVSDSEILDFMIEDSRRGIYLNPRKEGAVTLTIWDADGVKKDAVPVEIQKSDLGDVADEAKALLDDANIDVRIDGRKVVLSGEATSKVALEQAASLAARYGGVENNVQMSGEVLQTVAERVERAIATPGISVRNIRGRLVLEGVAFSNAAAKRAAEIGRIYEPDILDLIEVRESNRRPGQDRLVRLDVYFMEVKKEAIRTFGINWAPGSTPMRESSGGGGMFGGIADGISSIIGFVFNLVPKLRMANEKGMARVLDNATIIVKSGEVGEFFSGTEVPYYSGGQVTFKNVGIKLHAEPVASADAIDLKIDAGVSSLAANIAGGIDTRNVSTSAYVRRGQSIVLANMVGNRDVAAYNKTPSNIDTSSALFNLALSKDFIGGRSEFVVFIIPEFVADGLPAEERLREYLGMEKEMVKDRSKKEYRKMFGDTAENGGNKGNGRRRKWR